MKLRIALLSCLLAVTAFAADVTGKWNATMKGRNGNSREVTFNLKADGDNLTGTVSGRNGDTEIKNGKVDGDNISFDVVREFNGNQITQHYTGKVEGSTINFKMQMKRGDGEAGPEREFTAKRAS